MKKLGIFFVVHVATSLSGMGYVKQATTFAKDVCSDRGTDVATLRQLTDGSFAQGKSKLDQEYQLNKAFMDANSKDLEGSRLGRIRQMLEVMESKKIGTPETAIHESRLIAYRNVEHAVAVLQCARRLEAQKPQESNDPLNRLQQALTELSGSSLPRNASHDNILSPAVSSSSRSSENSPRPRISLDLGAGVMATN
jgi:hypothetical protein